MTHKASLKMILHIFLFGLIYDITVAAKPQSLIYADDKVQNYLMNFGYLPQSDVETGNLRTDDQLREAIKNLQSYGGIPVTGEIDDATQKLMRSRRCGLPDELDPRYKRSRHKRFTLHGQPWVYKNLTWSLRTERPSGLDTYGVRQELSRALDLWARNSKLTFQEVNSDRADILISFQRGYHGDGYPFDGRGQILAHAFFPGRDRGGDAHFDEDEIWLLQNDSNEEGTSLFAVAAHEFGHSLGLAHSSVRGALMYPWYQGISQNYELPEDDRNGIQQMYGAPEDRLWANLPGVPFTTTTTTTTTPRTRPTRRFYPPTRPNTYPDERDRAVDRPKDRYPYKPDYRNEQPERPVWTERPRKPHRHHPIAPTTTSTSVPPTAHRPRHRWTSTPKNDIPDKCDTSYDAITHIRREIFIFKGRYLWRVGDQGPYEGYPVEIIRLFNLPYGIDHVDAVYERLDGKIVIFIGRNYYVFNAHKLEPGYPRSLKYLGLPESLEKIDAAMVWGYNNRTYFFSGTMYWRFDESDNSVELDYPRDMSMFGGVDYNIDTVFKWKNGKTYFFKGKGFWEFNDMRMRVAHVKPKPSAPFWMGCPPEMETNDVDLPERRAKIVQSAADRPTIVLPLIISLLIVLKRIT